MELRVQALVGEERKSSISSDVGGEEFCTGLEVMVEGTLGGEKADCGEEYLPGEDRRLCWYLFSRVWEKILLATRLGGNL